MANPLATLRKYQFAFFVFFGVVCMLVFVIGDPLDTWLRSRSGAARAENKLVVSWAGGEIRENELGYTQSVRNVIREFIGRLQAETQKKNGQSRVAPLTLSPREEDIVYTRLLAQRAEASGMVVTDEMALLYLDQLTANLIPRNGIGSLFHESVGGRISEHQLIREIKLELLAQNYLSLIYPDLTQGQLPAQAWQYHLRLNRRLKAEVVPVSVANLVEKVTRQPTDAEIDVLYAEAKDRYPDPASPEPGFRRHRTAAFEFVRADRKKFEEEETAKLKAEVTEPEILDYYEKNKIEFRIPELPIGSPAPPAGPAAPPVQPPVEPSNASPTPDANQPATSDKPATPDKPATSDKPASESGKGTDPAPEKSSPPAAEPPSPATDAKPESAPPAGTPAPAGTGTEPPGLCTEDPPAAETAKSGKASPEVASPQDANPSKPEPQGENQGAATGQSTPDKSTPDKSTPDKSTPDKSTPDKSAEGAVAVPGAEPALPAAGSPPAGTANPVSPGAPPAPAEPKYKPLDDTLKGDIRERIAKQKAARVAQERIDRAFEAVRQAVERYGRNLRSAELAGQPTPAPVDLAKLAESHGMTAGEVPLSNPTKVQETELGKTQGFDFSSMSFEPIPFHVLAYRDGIPLWKPDQIRGGVAAGNADVEFLYWKTKEEEPFVPELKDIRDEVVQAWKLKQAVSLAEAEAKSLAEKARQGGKPLKELFSDQPDRKVAETNAFSWMTRGFLPVNMGGSPSLSAVDNVEMPGEEFMRSVFALKPGEIGTAINQPRSVVYVVRIDSESPDEETLREQFLQSGNSVDIQQIAFFDRAELRRNWLESLRRELNLKWERTPQS